MIGGLGNKTAEDIFHDLGVFSMMSSDSQAMGRVGEGLSRTRQSADRMKGQGGSLEGDPAALQRALQALVGVEAKVEPL